MPPHTRVLLIEHNRLLRDAITLLLAAQPDVALVGAVASGEAALRESHAKNAQVVLVDLGLKDDDSARVVRELKRTAPDVRIIAMDLFPVHEDVVELVRSEEHTSELQSRLHLVCRLLLEKKKNNSLQSLTNHVK